MVQVEDHKEGAWVTPDLTKHIQNTAPDRRCAMFHSNTHVCRHPSTTMQNILQNSWDKISIAYPKEQSFMKYSLGLPQDPCLRQAALETERKRFAKIIL